MTPESRDALPDQSARRDWDEISRVRRLFGLPVIPNDHFYVADPENPGECGNPTCFLPRGASCHLAGSSDELEASRSTEPNTEETR